MKPAILISLLLLGACQLFKSGTLDAADVLIKEQIPALVQSLQEDAEARKEATHSLKKILDWLDYILAGTAAGLVALIFTASKTARRYLRQRFKRRE
jgi:light-regulated signal transduction histidine kinase (bacteriophytochrome)